MNKALLGLASNVANKQLHMAQAIARLQEICASVNTSSAYETDPVGAPLHPRYLNAVAAIETECGLTDFHRLLKAIEVEHGRTPESKLTGEIPLDIDIVTWNDDILRPRDWERAYFRIGLRELNPSDYTFTINESPSTSKSGGSTLKIGDFNDKL